MKKQKALKVIQVTAILAVIISSYLLYQHFSPEESPFCNFGESFNCDIVNKGEYSTVDGVANLMLKLVTGKTFYLSFPLPNSLISLVIFVAVFFAASRIKKNKPFFGVKEQKLIKMFRVIMILSLLYAAFLVYIEARVLYSWCIFCLALDAVMIVMAYALFTMEAKK